MTLAIHYCARLEKKVWSHAGVLCATIYTTMISINYYVQLTYVAPHLAKGDAEGVRFALFTPFDSFLYSVDILGYSFMSLATLFTAFVFMGRGLERTLKLFMIANGLLIPLIALQTYYHPLIWGATAWAITFPGTTIAATIYFKRLRNAM